MLAVYFWGVPYVWHRLAIGFHARPRAAELRRLQLCRPRLTAAQLASVVAVPPGRIRLRVTGIVDKLRAADINPPIAIENEPECFRWTGP
jgi:hypothetical protein